MVGRNDALAPIQSGDRIQALDVIRGFALWGIFLMNVEWFNRPIAELDQGLPANLHGLDLLAGWGIHLLVRGKFWTMFSLLFGMGFAVMLTRAERAGRDFVVPYLRRIAALALFGVGHYILLWAGDILFSYAVAASLLMLVFFGRAGWMLAGIVACFLLAAMFGLEAAGAAGFGIGIAGLMALYLRDGTDLPIAGRDVPLVSLLLWSAGLVLVAVGLAGRNVGPGIFGLVLLASAAIAWCFRQPPALRALRAGAHLYLAAFLGMALVGAALTVAPSLRPAPTAQQAQESADRQAEQAAAVRAEAAAMSGDSYLATVRYRLGTFPDNAGNDLGFAGLVVAMFLIGVWFVRSGVIERAQDHLALFRRLAFVALPVGLLIGVASAAVAVTHVPGQNDARYQLATGLLMAGNLPACLGYVGAIVLLLYSRGPGARVALLAPAGRMALTNYLGQSLLQGLYFYGYGLGHWGTPRAQQVVFVLVVYSLQVAFSHWWLARFHFGPMEWLWRAATYWQWPPMRRTATA